MAQSQITFRRVEPDDLPFIVAMVVDLCIELGHDTCPDTIRESVEANEHNPMIDCFVAVDKYPIGVACFMTAPAMYNRNIRHSHECFWYVDPSYRGSVGVRLIKCVEDNLKTDILDFGISNPRLQKLLQRRGYTYHKSIMRKASWA